MRESNHFTIEFPASSQDVLTELLRRDRWPGYRAAGASTNRSTKRDARLCRECVESLRPENPTHGRLGTCVAARLAGRAGEALMQGDLQHRPRATTRKQGRCGYRPKLG